MWHLSIPSQPKGSGRCGCNMQVNGRCCGVAANAMQMPWQDANAVNADAKDIWLLVLLKKLLLVDVTWCWWMLWGGVSGVLWQWHLFQRLVTPPLPTLAELVGCFFNRFLFLKEFLHNLMGSKKEGSLLAGNHRVCPGLVKIYWNSSWSSLTSRTNFLFI